MIHSNELYGRRGEVWDKFDGFERVEARDGMSILNNIEMDGSM